MTLEQLRALVLIVENGSIFEAADKMNRSQPALSASIKKLEQELDIILLSRDTFRASVTSEGHALYQKAKIILNESSNMKVMAKQIRQGEEVNINLGYPAFLSVSPLNEILRECQREYPHIQFNLMADYLGGGIERLLDNKIEIALIPAFDDHLKIESHYFMHIPFVTVCSPSLVNSESMDSLTIEDIRRYIHVVVTDSSQHTKPKNSGILEGQSQWIVNDIYTKKKLILAGIGWGRLPLHLISNELKKGDLISIDINGYSRVMQREVRLARLINQPLGPIALKIWQRLLNYRETIYDNVHDRQF